jgi:ribosomal peptide maturation radical SAM protein 1
MPFSPVERPSYACGLLKSVLTRAGFSVVTRHACLRFTERINKRTYSLLSRIRIEDGPVDWAFAPIAFPQHVSDPQAYLTRLFERNPITWSEDPADDFAALLALRERAPAFVEETVEYILSLGPRIVGCTSTFQQHVASLGLLRRLKQKAPDIVTMIGGANCETIMGRTTHENFTWVDYVVSGEAEDLLPGLCRQILAPGIEVPPEQLADGVFGPVHRRSGYPAASYGDGVPRAVAKSIVDQPLPDYREYFSELDGSSLRSRVTVALPLETSRGCWWGEIKHCKFCGLNGSTMSYRSKPGEAALSEIAALQTRYGISRFLSVDNILDLKYFKEFIPTLAQTKQRATFFYETKSNLSRRQVKALADAGVIWLQPGIEAMHTGLLDLMDKGSQAWRNVQLLRFARQFGIRLQWAILCGFPGEDESWFNEMATWLPLLSHLEPGYLKGLRFDRYSPYFRDASRYGLRLRPAEMYRYFYPLPQSQLADLVYFFEADGRDMKGYHLLSADLADRPSLEGLRRIMAGWYLRWHGPERPVLLMEDHEAFLMIFDTRSCAPARHVFLTGLERELYLICDEAPTVQGAVNQVSRDGFWTADDAEEVIEDLVRRRLLLLIDGHAISLAVPEPLPEMPSDHDFPGGILLEDVAQAEHRAKGSG